MKYFVSRIHGCQGLRSRLFIPAQTLIGSRHYSVYSVSSPSGNCISSCPAGPIAVSQFRYHTRGSASFRESKFVLFSESRSVVSHFKYNNSLLWRGGTPTIHCVFGGVGAQKIIVRKMSASTRTTNRLINEKSPYLLQHAHNPVDWYPWGEEAFKKAREENKPIFLSVGYSTCHWCHVMERETFENPEIGQLLSENFVSIKVDREERPDVDRVYMTFVQATTGSGGWPMSVWLTPDLTPIVGGTYFPPDDRYYNRPGFKSILGIISQQWNENKSEIEAQGTKIVDALMQGLHATDANGSIPDASVSGKCFQMLDKTFDKEEGGFGTSPKFPQPVTFNILFRYFYRDPNSESGAQALQMCLFTLNKMANGGIHDHVAQGFHRYSTDRKWHVPHFEKMLYDQGQLAVSYVDAYQITKDDFYSETAKDIFTYVSRDLSHPEGGFYSAEDADSLPTPSAEKKREGAFCVWEFEEIQQLLSEPLSSKPDICLAEIFCHYYGVKENGNVDPIQDPHEELKNQNVLIVTSTIEETASKFDLSRKEVQDIMAKSRAKLYEARQKRPPPHLDNKMVSAWNGLMISGFARGGQALGDAALTERAIKAAGFLKQHMYNPQTGTMLRSCYTADDKGVAQISRPIQGFLDDYAYVIRGLLDLYESCFDDQWLAWAEQLQTKQNELFWDSEGGGYFSSKDGDSSIVLRMKEDQDGAEPSPNAVSVMNLLRFSTILGNAEWAQMAERIFKVFSERIDKVPMAVPELVSALMLYHSTPKQIIIVGDKNGQDTKALIETVHKLFLPNKVLLVTDGHSDNFLHERLDILSSLTKLEGKATAYVCENFSCKLPVTSSVDLQKQLEMPTSS